MTARHPAFRTILTLIVLTTAAANRAAAHDLADFDVDLSPRLERFVALHPGCNSTNHTLRALDEAGDTRLTSDRALLDELGRVLTTSTHEPLLSELISAAVRLRLVALGTSLDLAARRPELSPVLRMHAARAAAAVSGDHRTLNRWVGEAEEDLPKWNTAEQQIFLSLLPWLPAEDSVHAARFVADFAKREAEAIDKNDPAGIARLGEFGNLRDAAVRAIAEAERAAAFEALAPADRTPRLIDEFVENFSDPARRDRVLALISRLDIRVEVAREAARRLKAAPDERTSNGLRLLLDRLGERLEDADHAQLEATFPPPPQ